VKQNVSLQSWIIITVLSIIWGSSFILIKKSLLAYSPAEVGALRISISTLAFLPVLLVQLKNYDRKNLIYFVMVGLCGSGIPAFLYAIAQTEVDSSVAGVLNSLTPIWALLIGIIIFKATFQWMQLGGVFLGFLGACLLIFLRSTDSVSSNLYYSGLIIFSTILYGTSVNLVKYKLSNYRPLMISSLSFVFIGPLAMLYLTQTDIVSDTLHHPDGWKSLGSITALALLSTVFATILFYKLVKDTNAIFAASVAFLIPIVALFFGFIDGEKIGLYHILSMGLILLGVLTIRRAK